MGFKASDLDADKTYVYAKGYERISYIAISMIALAGWAYSVVQTKNVKGYDSL